MVGWAHGGPGSGDLALLGGSWGFLKAWKPPEPAPLCWPFGGYPWLFSFPLISDPLVLKPYPQAPSPLPPSLLPRADTKIFLLPLEKSWEVCLWLLQSCTHICACSWDSWKGRNWSF